MSYIELPQPDWDALLGGSAEAAWIADRNRKFGMAAELARQALDCIAELRRRDALFQCSPEVLREVPFSADWYVSLAGFSLKTLGNIKAGPANFGIRRNAKGLVESLRKRRSVPPEEELTAFSAWVNSEIGILFPPHDRDPQHAIPVAFMVLGGRSLGRGQNKGGSDAVTMLTLLLVDAFVGRGRGVEVQPADGRWVEHAAEHNLPERQRLRIGGCLVCEFSSAGDRPDICIYRNDVLIAVGEIKGRKDLANKWESWMPGVYSHLRSWFDNNPDAARLFFGTLVNRDMIEGRSAQGTTQLGFKKLKGQGLLNGAYNISKIADKDPAAVAEFGTLIEALDGLINT